MCLLDSFMYQGLVPEYLTCYLSSYIVSMFLQVGDQGMERFSDLLKVTQLVGIGLGIYIRRLPLELLVFIVL